MNQEPRTAKEEGSASGSLRPLLGEFLTFGGSRAPAVAVLMILGAVLEGAGVMLLVPMLQLVGVTGASASNSSAGWVGSALSLFHGSPSLPLALGGYVILVALHAIICWQRDIRTDRLQQGFADHLRQELFDGIGSAEWEFLARTHSAEFSHALTADLGRISLAVSALLQLTTTGIVTAAYVALAIRLSLPLSCLTLGVGVLLLQVLRRHHRHAHDLGKELTQSIQRMHGGVTEYLAGLKLAKSGNAEARLSARFAEHMHDARGYVLAFTSRQAGARSLLQIGGALALAVLVYTALAIVAIPAATALVLVFIFMRLLPFLSVLQQSYERLLHELPAYASFTQMRKRCRDAEEPAAKGQSYTLRHAVRVEKICYRPANAESDILSDVSLTIPWRSTSALIGPSGAGKSTLADLLGGLLQPRAGFIGVDDRVLDDRRAWRESVAYVTQDTFLFNAAVRANLLWAAPEATDTDIWNALEQAAAANFVRALPQGLDTVLGERGIRLSGGERQRLAIARALLRKPQLLILDEATSSLDRDNEQRIQSALANLHGQLTIVVIAHRLTTVREADQIVVMQQGRVSEIGTYDVLAAKAGSYLTEAGVTANLSR